MKKKQILSVMLASILTLSMLLSACGKSEEETTNEDSSVSAEDSSESTEESAEIDTSDVEIEAFIVAPWVNRPVTDGDAYTLKYMSDTWGGTWTIHLATEGETELVTRMASGDEPDLILFEDDVQLQKMYDEGVLIDDWNVYADKLPTFLEAMTETQRDFYTTEDGKLKGITYAPGDQKWTFCIRQDWLANLGLSMPTNPEELLDVMRAFTFDDPDGNGVDDTYGFSTAVLNEDVGNIRSLLYFFGDPDVYITEDGEVSNALVDGSFKEYLDFAKTVVDEGLINPDWYTIGWDDRKPSLYQGAYGILEYPPAALISEMIAGLGIPEEEQLAFAESWGVLDTCGGKARADQILSSDVISVSAKCAADPAKMEVICNFLEDCSFGSEYYGAIRNSALPDIEAGSSMTSDGSTYVYEYKDASVMSQEDSDWYNGSGDNMYGMFINHKAGNLYGGTTEEPNEVTEYSIKLNGEVDALEKVSGLYQLYSPDPTLDENLSNKLDEFEIAYIMGETTDYDGFVTEWLEAGGQQYLDDAKAQFEALGLIE